ncbi:MAG: DUF6527 family protein [Pseudomonadaceae bacterium]|nr:DUF6527 family protein [Pseudomonadaceae bacterium]
MAELVRQTKEGTWLIECPACTTWHEFDSRWTFNGDVEKPTFSPSLRVRWTYGEDEVKHCCHSFVRDGQWQYCVDSTHKLAGQTVPVPPFAES